MIKADTQINFFSYLAVNYSREAEVVGTFAKQDRDRFIVLVTEGEK